MNDLRVIVLVVVSLALYLWNRYIPIQGRMAIVKTIVNVVVVVATLGWLVVRSGWIHK
jgi:hypothetical protein